MSSATSLKVINWSSKGWSIYDPSLTRMASPSDVAVSGQQVIVAVSRRASFVRSLRVPDAAKSQVIESLRITAGDHLPLPASEIAFDVLLTDQTSLEGRLAVLAAMKTDLLDQLTEEMKEAGARVVKVLPAAFGSIPLAKSLGLVNAAVVDRDEEGFTIDVIVGGELRATRALGPGIKESQLAEEIDRTFAGAGLNKGSIVAAGGTAIAGADHIVSRSILSYLSEVGSQIDVHLEPFEAVHGRLKKVQASRNRLAGIMVLATAGLGLIAYLDISDKASKVAAQDAKWQKSHSFEQQKLDKKTTEANAAAKQAEVLRRAFEPAQRLSDVITTIANEVPADVWVSSITAERGKPINIRGTALKNEQVAAFLSRLAGQERLRDTGLVFSNNGTIEQRPVVQFSIQAIANGNLPVTESDKVAIR